MTDPHRWTEDPDAPEGAAELLGAGKRRAPGMPPEVRARVGAAVATLAAGGAAATASASAPVAAGLSSTAKMLSVIAVVIVGGGLFGGGMYALSDAPPAPASAVEVRDVAPAIVEPTIAPVVEPAAAPIAVEAAAPIEAPAPRRTERVARPAPEATTPEPEAPSDPLAEESALLREAHTLLEAEPERALALATTHARRFPDGQMVAERELVAIDALARMGRIPAARARADRLAARYPRSPYITRAEQILARVAPH